MPEAVATVRSALDEVLASTLNASLSETPPTATEPSAPSTPAPESGRDEKGRFAKAEAEKDADSTPPEGDEPPPEEQPPVLPEGIVLPKAISGEGLAFKVLDDDGELEVPAITVEYTANGKVRKDDLPQLVKMAQWGVYNAEKESHFKQMSTAAMQMQEQAEALYAENESLKKEREWLLSSDDNYISARTSFDQRNTPEARLARTTEELQLQKESAAFREQVTQSEQMFHSEVVPAITAISTALPNVTADELGAKILLAIEPYRVDTKFGKIVPPRHHDAVRQTILSEVVPWAKATHDERTQRFGAVSKQAKQEVADAKAKADRATADSQKTKNLIGRAMKPAGRPQREAKPEKAIVTVQDGMDAAVRDTLASLHLNG